MARFYGTRPGRLVLAHDVARLAHLTEPSTILEIGCGDGATALHLAQSCGCRVYGVDVARDMVLSARQRALAAGMGDRVTFQQASASHLPLAAGAVDTVWGESVLSTLPEKSRPTAEFRRVLAPGGRLIMLDFVLREQVSQELQQQVALIPCLGRTRRVAEYVSLFEQAGFRDAYCQDLSAEVRRSGYWLGTMYGSLQELLARLSAGSCSCDASRRTRARSIVAGYQRFLKEARLGYALIMMTRA